MEFIERDGIEVFQEEFLEFAGYNIQRRAIPDARDGLKWGARKLLHSQMLGKFTYDKPFKKAAKSVSQAMGFSYTHGNASAYGTFIRMAKPFAYRVPLQEAKGNYGTLISPDDHSADRYVELRGSEAAAYLLRDLDKDTIDEWEETYDMEGFFPKVLPAKGFWGGINGCISIGSGMTSSLPPLNIVEANEAMIKLLWNPELPAEEVIVYPDFPTGAILLNKEEVKQSLINGNGRACKVRSVIEWDEKERVLIVKELPYSTYTNTICRELSDIINSDDNPGIKDFFDYTGRAPELHIHLDKKLSVQKALKFLYKNTSLETHFSINMTVLDKGINPCVMGQKELFLAHINHEIDVYTRGFVFDLQKIKSRLHIIEGLLKAISIIDEVIALIKGAADTKNASRGLQQEFGFTEAQAKAILDIKLARLAHLEVSKLEKEKGELEKEKGHIEAILNDEALLKKEIEKGLREVANKFGDARRTKILNIENEEDEPTEIRSLQFSLTNKNNIYLAEVSSLYTQKRGGVGSKFKLDSGEYVISSVGIESNDTVLFFAQDGNYYSYSAAAIPVGERLPIQALIEMNDKVSICAVCSLNKKMNKENILFITKNGLIKKSLLTEYNTKRSGAIRALNLDDGDEIISVIFTNKERVGLLTEMGNFLIIETSDIRPIGRVARGVRAIKLNPDDYVISGRPVPSSTKMIVSISGEGLIKKTPISEFAAQGKNTKGAKLQKLTDSDWMADFLPTEAEEILINATSSCIKIKTEEIPELSRGAQGNKAIKLSSGNNVVGLS